MKQKLLRLLSRFRKPKPKGPKVLTPVEEDFFRGLHQRTHMDWVGEGLEHLEYERALRGKMLNSSRFDDLPDDTTLRIHQTIKAITAVEDAVFHLFKHVNAESGIES